jgi:hypothetical protein
MSHLTHVKNVFTRKDLLLDALRRVKFGIVIEEPGRVRFYAGDSAIADIVAKLQHYDLGFVLQFTTSGEAYKMMDDDEDAYTFMDGKANCCYVPICDFWNGEVEAVFGKNLCELNAVYYSLLLCESIDNISQTTITDTEDKILVTIEI